MIDAFKTIMEMDGVESEWAKERVRRLFSGPAGQRDEKQMTVTMGGVRLTVSGAGMALLIAPELSPASQGEDRPEE